MQAPYRTPDGVSRSDPASVPYKSFSDHGQEPAPAIVGGSSSSTHHRKHHQYLSKSLKRSSKTPRQIGVLPKVMITWDAHYPTDASSSSSFKERILSFASLEAVEEEDTDYSESSAPPRRGLIGFIEKLRHPEASFWPIKKHHATFKRRLKSLQAHSGKVEARPPNRVTSTVVAPPYTLGSASSLSYTQDNGCGADRPCSASYSFFN